MAAIFDKIVAAIFDKIVAAIFNKIVAAIFVGNCVGHILCNRDDHSEITLQGYDERTFIHVDSIEHVFQSAFLLYICLFISISSVNPSLASTTKLHQITNT